MKRTALKQTSRRRTKSEATRAAEFFDRVVATTEGKCWLCDAYAWDAHHLIRRQNLKHRGLDQWDPRDGVPLCRACHENVHSGVRPILRSELPAGVFEFAAEYGLEDLLARWHPEDVA